MKITRLFLLLGLLGLLCLNACGGRPSPPPAPPAEVVKKSPPVGKKPEVAPPKNLAKKQEINRLLEGKDYLAALAMLRKEVGRGAVETEFREEYSQALSGAAEQGQSRLAENNPAQAGLLLRAVLDHFPKDAELARSIGLTTAELEVKIGLCADKQMEKGLIAYRAGKLEAAIEEWKKTLAFQPRHRATKNAIQTAEVQLTNLKKIESGK